MIIRDPRPSDKYTLIHTDALADGRLSFKARGILAMILAMDTGAVTTVERLARSGADGERAVKSGLKELEEHGYLIRTTDGDTVSISATDTPGMAAETPPPAPTLDTEGVGEPTPNHGPSGWQPSEAARKTAEDNIQILDIPLSITLYRIRVKELGREPSSGEWLRWLVKDEEKARIEERRRKQAESAATSKWWSTASD
jgi:hypothetical protein